MTERAVCEQCGKPAIASVGTNRVNICLDHYLALQRLQNEEQRNRMAMINFLYRQADNTTGLGAFRPTPQIEVPQSLIFPQGNIFNNINVEKSTIGSINTGNVHSIDVAMEQMRGAGNAALVDAMKQFTEAVIANTSLDDDRKNEILERLSFLSDQSTLEPPQRKLNLVRSVLAGINETVSTVTSLATLWNVLAPLLSQVFS